MGKGGGGGGGKASFIKQTPIYHAQSPYNLIMFVLDTCTSWPGIDWELLLIVSTCHSYVVIVSATV